MPVGHCFLPQRRRVRRWRAVRGRSMHGRLGIACNRGSNCPSTRKRCLLGIGAPHACATADTDGDERRRARRRRRPAAGDRRAPAGHAAPDRRTRPGVVPSRRDRLPRRRPPAGGGAPDGDGGGRRARPTVCRARRPDRAAWRRVWTVRRCGRNRGRRPHPGSSTTNPEIDPDSRQCPRPGPTPIIEQENRCNALGLSPHPLRDARQPSADRRTAGRRWSAEGRCAAIGLDVDGRRLPVAAEERASHGQADPCCTMYRR